MVVMYCPCLIHHRQMHFQILWKHMHHRNKMVKEGERERRRFGQQKITLRLEVHCHHYLTLAESDGLVKNRHMHLQGKLRWKSLGLWVFPMFFSLCESIRILFAWFITVHFVHRTAYIVFTFVWCVASILLWRPPSALILRPYRSHRNPPSFYQYILSYPPPPPCYISLLSSLALFCSLFICSCPSLAILVSFYYSLYYFWWR